MINYTYTSQHFMHQTIFSSDVFFMFQSDGVRMKQSLSSIYRSLVMLGSSDVFFMFLLYPNFFINSLTNYGTRINKLLMSNYDFTFKGFQTRSPKFLVYERI